MGMAGGAAAERGSVTVEAAVALSAIMVVLATCLAGLACLTAALRVTDAASEAARLAARGDQAAARQVVQRLAPAGSVLSLSGTDLVTARVTAPPLGGVLPGIRVSAIVVAAREPGGDDP
jgi:Flp pilus assembly protein TadG